MKAEESREALIGESHSIVLEHDSTDPSASSAADVSDELNVFFFENTPLILENKTGDDKLSYIASLWWKKWTSEPINSAVL
jgi:hypothetical protein